MIRRPLGKHLHDQIIRPLAVVAAVVAAIATLVAIGAIGRIVDRWVDRSATSTAALVEARISHRSEVTQRNLELISTDPRVITAIGSGDDSGVRSQLSLASRALGVDGLMVMDAAGRVSAAVGSADAIAPGQVLEGIGGELELDADGPLLARHGTDYFVVVAAPVTGPDAKEWHLVAATGMQRILSAECGSVVGAGVLVLDADGTPIASAAHGDEAMRRVIQSITPEDLGRVLADSEAEGQPVRTDVEVDGVSYRAAVRDLRFANDGGTPAVHLVTVVDMQMARDARSTTAWLIAMWLVFGVAGLVALNWYVARRVTQPIEALSESVARVAGGDFAATAEVPGSNEISELADDFNRMTESLRERSDSLTKKVLELATLYEMSRSLGSTLDLQTLLDSVLDSAMRIFDVEIGYVTMVDRESRRLEMRSSRGIDLGRANESSVRSSMSDWVVREGRPLIFNPTGESADGETNGDAVSGALAALCVPLLSSEGTIGAITVGTRDAGQRFTSDDVRLLATIANHVTIAIGNIELFSNVQEAYLATVRALAAAVDAKDPYTRGHSDGVAAYALRIGEAMGLSSEQMIALEMAAYLHDIGKIGISEDILLKPGKLTDAEMSQMRHHPLIGANILKPVAFPWPIAPIVRHHHEHYNGEGYPAGLRGEEIPVLARVLTAADAFEAMVADRPYRRGRSQQEAILELRRCSGTHFDPRVVEVFIEVLEAMEAERPDASPEDEEIRPEEAQAVLVALCDGMFSSFRRLGGPRLANNLERTANDGFAARGMPLVLRTGHVTVVGEGGIDDDELLGHLRGAIELLSECIEDASGAGLADHFLSEALVALPERMRQMAAQLGVAPAT